MVLKIAARKSDLARLQAFEVGQAIRRVSPNLKIEFSFRASLGDQKADDPLWKMPEKGVFTEDFVADLERGTADMVVHSWKDLPTHERGLTHIAATLDRADVRDVLLVRRDRWRKFWSKNAADETAPQPESFRVLTSSPRRAYNLAPFLKWALPWRSDSPHIEFLPVRGNIATRVGKLADPTIESASDALVVAKAAIDRLLESGSDGHRIAGLDSAESDFRKSAGDLRQRLDRLDFVVLPLSANPTAAAQGALAVEIRSNRKDLIDLCSMIDRPVDRSCVEDERRELAKHGGGCHQKIGVTVLDRPYGRVKFLRGLTDAGTVLNEKRLIRKLSRKWESVGHRFVSSVSTVVREPIEFPKQLAGQSFFVARADAWPKEDLQARFVWTAGLETWRKLSAGGVWVNGSSEGLGDLEEARIDMLAGSRISWRKLTHADSSDDPSSIPTYRVTIEPPDREELLKARFFYWKSGSQFRAALSVCPEIVEGFHASGPGHTHAVLRETLKAKGVVDADLRERVAVFLNESDFLNQTTSSQE